MSLLGALGLGRGGVVAAVGAGGKTTLLYRLAHEAHSAGLRVLVTSTTHMGPLPEATTGPLLLGDVAREAIEEAVSRTGLVTLLGKRVRPDKIEGISAEQVDSVAPLVDLVLVEADGARGRSLKLPAPHEPVLPGTTGVVLVLAGMDVLGAPLTDANVHRVALVTSACGRAEGEPVDAEALLATLLHETGYLSRIPPGVRAGVFLNKAEGEPLGAAEVAGRLVPPYAFAAYGSAQSGTVALVE
ncbi:MAG TPA: selenium cofactor biosynthesis protein YqeC [Vicinamibacteria bacterium]|jgi:probable selenium-dependent hydroxylase accessory protein YqeC|nr:selenium cofactor biosynthesis protein YqeC [Vicinamibacteria bacterium]